MKIICVGMHKTGTTSLGQAFRMLDYETTGWRNETASLYKRGHADALLDMMEDFDAFEDAPWFLLYKEACKRHACKLILTKRISDDVWFESLIKHNDRNAPDAFSLRGTIYGQSDLLPIRDRVIAYRKRHDNEVREFAAENDIPLLEVCWERGDGWKQLCAFLGLPEPAAPFPHANKAPETRLFDRLRKRAFF